MFSSQINEYWLKDIVSYLRVNVKPDLRHLDTFLQDSTYF